MIEKYAKIRKTTIDSQFFQPDHQKSWSWISIPCENEIIIDLDKGFYFYVDVDKNCTIKFKNGTLGYQYIIFLKVASGKKITWKSYIPSEPEKAVYIRFAIGCRYDTNPFNTYDYVYLGGVLNYKSDTSNYLDFIAKANCFEEVET